MSRRSLKPLTCPIHGKPTQRATCKKCNAAYMRGYLREKRLRKPAQMMWERARQRAKKDGLRFEITPEMIALPEHCPVLGIPLQLGVSRSAGSPSLDRIEPSQGYVPGNVRVISDKANILKGDATAEQLRLRASQAEAGKQKSYSLVAEYVEREALLVQVRKRAQGEGKLADEWRKVAAFLDFAFQRSDLLRRG